MPKSKTVLRSIRMLPSTSQHLIIARRYFDCSMDVLLILMLNAIRIAPISDNTISDETIDNFYKEVNKYADADTYLLKD